MPMSDNVFTPGFLELIEGIDDGVTAQEAELSGPWKIVETDSGFALLRSYEDPEDGRRPEGLLDDFPTALRFLAVLPAVARPPLLKVDAEPAGGWYTVHSEGQAVGRLRVFHDRFVQAAQVAESLSRSPLALAALLLSAGPLAIREVGRLLEKTLTTTSPSGTPWVPPTEFPPRS